jgi:hypothetical protein
MKAPFAVTVLLAIASPVVCGGCTYVGVYGAPRPDPTLQQALRARVRGLPQPARIVIECARRTSLLACGDVALSTRAALEAAGFESAGSDVPGLHFKGRHETWEEYGERGPEPGILYFLVRGDSGNPTGWMLLSALTAGLIPFKTDGGALTVEGVALDPCSGRQVKKRARSEVRVWVSGPFIPSAWWGGSGARGLFDIYRGHGGIGAGSMGTAYADLGRRVALDLLERQEASRNCGQRGDGP